MAQPYFAAKRFRLALLAASGGSLGCGSDSDTEFEPPAVACLEGTVACGAECARLDLNAGSFTSSQGRSLDSWARGAACAASFESLRL